MKIINKQGNEIQVGDIIKRKDYRGRTRTYRIDEVRPHDVLATELGESSLSNITTVISFSALGLQPSLF